MEERGITSKDILYALGGGALIVSALFAPGAGHLAKPFLRWVEEDRRRLKYYLYRLKKRRLVHIVQRGDDYFLNITEAGKNILKRYELDDIKLAVPARWDKKWRIVTFDIPVKKNKARRALHQKLKELGFHQLQRSVFVIPYPCQNEVDFVVACFNIQSYVTYIEATAIDNEPKLVQRFRLLD